MLAEADHAAGDRGLLVRSSIVGLVVFGLVLATLASQPEMDLLAAVWPANAVVLCVLLRSRRSSWPAYLTAGLIGNLAAKFFVNRNLSPGVLLPFCNSFEIVLCATLTLRFIGPGLDLSQPRRLALFTAFAGLIAPAASGVASATVLTLWDGAGAWGQGFVSWWARDALGLLIITPALMALSPASLRELWGWVRTGRGTLSIAVFAATLALGFSQDRFGVRFLIPVALIFVAFELHLTGAALALLINAAAATVFTLMGGSIVGESGLGADGRIVALQAFLAAMTLLILPVAAALANRSRLEEELRRRQAETEATANDLIRSNWALSAYARALSAISHVDSLDAVAKAICSAIVEQEEYVLAGVARAEMKPGLPIVFFAADGSAADYLDGLTLSWSPQVAEGLGPSGQAVREFRPIVVGDSQEEPSLAAWRERASRHGIRSSVSVPFRSGENAVGILGIYARTPNAFGPRELELFFNLGRELGLAVSMSEARERLEALEAARRSAEQAARRAELDLARAGRILSVAEVTTSIAHEVNQPLAAILANAETALNWIGKPTPNLDSARAAMERVIRDAERAGDTVKRVRRMISKEPPQLSLCVLNQVVEETLSVMEHEIRMSGVCLHPALARQSPLVQVDKVQVEQVLVNLISNSLDAMRGSDGARTLTVRTGLADESTALVAVEDAGQGFEGAIEEKMFEHFFTTKEGGVGLGLALCRAIVQGHGGRIWAEPRAGGGAILQFTLPLVAVC